MTERKSKSDDIGGLGCSGKRKRNFIKGDMARDDDAICGEIKAAITLVVVRIAKENTWLGTWCKLVYGGGGEIRVTSIAETLEMGVIGK